MPQTFKNYIMNAVLEQWLNIRKAEEAKKRDQHLIELGLVDESKKVRVYTEKKVSKESQWDEARKAYFTEEPTAIEVTDQEYVDILYHESLMEVEEEEEPRARGNNGASTILIIVAILHFIIAIAGLFLWLSGENDPGDVFATVSNGTLAITIEVIGMSMVGVGAIFGCIYLALANTLKLHFKLLQKIECNTSKKDE